MVNPVPCDASAGVGWYPREVAGLIEFQEFHKSIYYYMLFKFRVATPDCGSADRPGKPPPHAEIDFFGL